MKKYKTYQIVVIIIGLFLCFFGRFIPVSSGLSASGAQTLFIMVGGLLMWLLVGVDWTSLAVILALALIPELGMNKVAAGTLGNSTVFYLLLCFMLAKSLQATGVAHRLAVWFLTGSFSRKGAWNNKDDIVRQNPSADKNENVSNYQGRLFLYAFSLHLL